jgi:hypothetical protein
MRAQLVLAALLISTMSVTASSGGNASSSKDDDASSLIGTWRLVLADDRPDKNGPWEHSYGEHPKGYLVYDETGHVSIQFSNDPPTPRFESGDDFKPTAHEAETAYLNYVAYFGTYSVDTVRHVVTHHVEGSLVPSYTGTDQERPYRLHGDNLELTDGETWRRVWVRVPPPDNRQRGP